MSIETPWAERAAYHIKQIVNRIGPRGAGTPEEKRAAEYVQQQLQQLDLRDIRLEAFNAPSYGWMVMAIAFSIAVWSVFFCWGMFYLTQTRIVGGVLGAATCVLALIVIYLEVTLRDHSLRRFVSRDRSHNTIGRMPATGAIKQRVVLVSHLDTTPAARVFKSPRRIRLFRLVFAVGAVSLFASVALYILGGLDLWDWAFVFAGICGLLQSAVIIQSLQADRGAFTPGANHNASGIGTVLALAERLKGTSLLNTEVWIVCCGSQTTGNVGLRALLMQHAAELHDAWFIGFEGVGRGDRLIYISREGWLRRSLHPAVRELIEQTLRENPDRSIEAHVTRRTTTIGTATWRRFRSLCLNMYDDDNRMPGEYCLEDTAQLIQIEALETAQDFGWRLLQQIDRK